MNPRDYFYWTFPTESGIEYIITGNTFWYTAASVRKYLGTKTVTATLLLTLPEEYEYRNYYVGKTSTKQNYRLRVFWSILFSEEAVKYLCRRRKVPYPDLQPLVMPRDIPEDQYTTKGYMEKRRSRKDGKRYRERKKESRQNGEHLTD